MLNTNQVKIVKFIALYGLLVVSVLSVGCGNKGELYREIDTTNVDGLAEAADKVKKRKKSGEQ